MSITPATCFNRTSWQCSTAEKSGTGSFDQSHWEMNSWLITEVHTPKYWGFTRASDSARASARGMKMKVTKILQTPLISKAVRELTDDYQVTRRPAAGDSRADWPMTEFWQEHRLHFMSGHYSCQSKALQDPNRETERGCKGGPLCKGYAGKKQVVPPLLSAQSNSPEDSKIKSRVWDPWKREI